LKTTPATSLIANNIHSSPSAPIDLKDVVMI